MTTIILTITGILLTAVAALMVIFYGGDSFNSGTTKAEAARLISESSQIDHAFKMYRAQEDRYPGQDGGDALGDLVARQYLTDVPKGVGNGAQPWTIDYEMGVARSTLGASDNDEARSICLVARRQYNLQGDTVYRCDGSDHPSGSLPSMEPCCVMPDPAA